MVSKFTNPLIETLTDDMWINNWRKYVKKTTRCRHFIGFLAVFDGRKKGPPLGNPYGVWWGVSDLNARPMD